MYDGRMRDRAVTITGAAVVGAAATLGVVRYVGGSPAETGPEGALAALALAAVLATPGLLALLGRAGRRPSLYVVAGVALAPLSFLSFSGVTLPLLVPAAALAVAGARRIALDGRRCAPLWVMIWAVTSVLVAAVVALFAHHDPRSWETATASGSTSDVITVAESLLSLWLVGLALTLGWYLATPLPRADGRLHRPARA
jgi:hypothetical protein